MNIYFDRYVERQEEVRLGWLATVKDNEGNDRVVASASGASKKQKAAKDTTTGKATRVSQRKN